MEKDFVCGMNVDGKKSLKAKYKTKEYYFCSQNCKIAFEKNPEKYIN